jgi:hypothetical protein
MDPQASRTFVWSQKHILDERAGTLHNDERTERKHVAKGQFMRYFAISVLLVLSAILHVRADGNAPTTQPNTDAVKGTAAEQAVTIYQKAIDQADEEFERKVKILQQEYAKKAEVAYKIYLPALRNAQAAETRAGKLEAALAIKSLADLTEASGPAASPAVEGAARDAAARKNGGWFVLFRSADPTMWNTDTNKGPNATAVSLTKAPKETKYLKLAVATEKYVIIPMTKEKLGEEFADGKHGWSGKCHFTWNAYHLGIYSSTIEKVPSGVDLSDQYRGWGFGHHQDVNDKQGYGWAGHEIGQAVFEISVKVGPLSEEEKKNLVE